MEGKTFMESICSRFNGQENLITAGSFAYDFEKISDEIPSNETVQGSCSMENCDIYCYNISFHQFAVHLEKLDYQVSYDKAIIK